MHCVYSFMAMDIVAVAKVMHCGRDNTVCRSRALVWRSTQVTLCKALRAGRSPTSGRRLGHDHIEERIRDSFDSGSPQLPSRAATWSRLYVNGAEGGFKNYRLIWTLLKYRGLSLKYCTSWWGTRRRDRHKAGPPSTSTVLQQKKFFPGRK